MGEIFALLFMALVFVIMHFTTKAGNDMIKNMSDEEYKSFKRDFTKRPQQQG